MNDDLRVSRYVEEMGHEPPVDETSGSWQWGYRGSIRERELLLSLIQEEAEEAAEQMSLC